MSVAQILSEKGRDVVTVHQEVSTQEVAEILGTHKVGAAVVVDKNDRICGIMSERDIVRDIAKAGEKALSMPVSSCMTKKVVSCSEDDTIDGVMQLMTEGRFRHLPVVDGEKLTGIISIGDVVKRKIQQATKDAEDLKQYIAG